MGPRDQKKMWALTTLWFKEKPRGRPSRFMSCGTRWWSGEQEELSIKWEPAKIHHALRIVEEWSAPCCSRLMWALLMARVVYRPQRDVDHIYTAFNKGRTII